MVSRALHGFNGFGARPKLLLYTRAGPFFVARLAFAASLPRAVRTFFGKRFRFCFFAAFLTLRLAADFCFADAIIVLPYN